VFYQFKIKKGRENIQIFHRKKKKNLQKTPKNDNIWHQNLFVLYIIVYTLYFDATMDINDG